MNNEEAIPEVRGKRGMKKFYVLILGAILLSNLVFAETELMKISQEINDIGSVEQYQTGKNTYVGINLNLEMLYIATATGSGFTHPAYMVKNEIAERIKSYYNQFQSNEYAQKFNKLSQEYVNIPLKKFPTRFTAEVVSYQQILSLVKIAKGSPKFSALNIQEDLRCFYEETNSKKFFRENRLRYNEMTTKFVTTHNIDYISELEDFFGVSMAKNRFEILLSPLNNGGSAMSFENFDNTITYISIINPFYDDDYVMNLIIHENAHNFLQPVFIKNHDLIKQYEKYLKHSFGKAQGFVTNDSQSFLNELLARAITISIIDKYQNPDLAYELWLNEKMMGWDSLDEVCALIKNKYLLQHDKYPVFEDFLPVILEYYKAKSRGKNFDTGPKVYERTEIKEATVNNAYWKGDSRIPELKAKKPHSFFLAVEFCPLRNPCSLRVINNTGELITKFFDKAPPEFELAAEGKPKATARIYEGNIYAIDGGNSWGFWAVIDEEEFNKLEPGVVYKLIPKKQNAEYQWIIDDNVTLEKGFL